jgi:beta-mannosidase
MNADPDGVKRLVSARQAVTLMASSSQRVHTASLAEILAGSDCSTVVLEARLSNGDELMAHILMDFVQPAELELAVPRVEGEVERVPRGYRLTLTSNSLVRNVEPSPDVAAAQFSDNFFDLLPRGHKTVQLATTERLNVTEVLEIRTMVDSCRALHA